TGATGANGATGSTGAVGPQGPVGSTGATGAQGPIGLTGATGAVGPQGPVGATGSTGAIGPQGPVGATGSTGAIGPQGPVGATGTNGATGPMGPQGPVGLTGATGAVGPQGPAGAIGATGAAGSANINGTTDYVVKFTSATTGGNSQIQDNGTNLSISQTAIAPVAPSPLYLLNTYHYQQGINGDGQAGIYAYRTRDGVNDGTGYGYNTINSGVNGYSYWGDLYSFGVAGHCYNDFNRTGGVLGSKQDGSYWGSLGYRSSGLLTYGVYGSSAYANGAGRMSNGIKTGIGGGFYGDLMGGWVRGDIMGLTTMGSMYASYNIGNTYTTGFHADLVKTGGTVTPAYAVTSTTVKVYDDGSGQLSNGTIRVNFTPEYAALIKGNGRPTVTVSAMGQCNGLYIVSIDEAGFTVAEMNGGTSNTEFSWIAVGKRTDASNTEVPEELTSPNFTEKMQGVMFNDGNTQQSGAPVFWNGTGLQYSTPPADNTPKVEAPRK
ncbi:MAG TPA: hypothetical protein VK826_18460, partial [Bacteroidia bacterium]|nr:hypothetical protein [Bacteroidia bacterium]